MEKDSARALELFLQTLVKQAESMQQHAALIDDNKLCRLRFDDSEHFGPWLLPHDEAIRQAELLSHDEVSVSLVPL